MSAPKVFDEREVAAYVRGTLDEARREALEVAMLEDGELFDRVQREALLRRGLIRTDLAEPARAGGHGFGRIVDWFGGWAGGWVGAFLSVCVLGLGLRVWDLQRQLQEHAHPATGVPVVTILEQRAVLPGMSNEAAPAAVVGPALIEVDVSLSGDPAVDLVLEFADRRRYQQRVRPDARGYVTALVPSGQTLTGLAVRDAEGHMLVERHFGVPES